MAKSLNRAAIEVHSRRRFVHEIRWKSEKLVKNSEDEVCE
jgi:hypothetical protein